MTTTSENDKQANCQHCGYKVSAAGFMCIPCANKLVNSDKQTEPVAFYGLGSQLYGMDGRPVKFSLGTQFYTHPPAGVVRELVRATEELKYAIHMEVCLINALDRVDAALKSAKEHGL